MTSTRATLRKRSIIIYAIIVSVAIALYILKTPWEEYVRTLLGYYEEISGCFFILNFGLVVFRLFTVEKKGAVPETRRFRLGFGPIIDLAVNPLLDASLFYSALFMLYTIFQEGLSLDPFLIILVVAGILLYQSVGDMIKMGHTTFYFQTTEKVVRQ